MLRGLIRASFLLLLAVPLTARGFNITDVYADPSDTGTNSGVQVEAPGTGIVVNLYATIEPTGLVGGVLDFAPLALEVDPGLVMVSWAEGVISPQLTNPTDCVGATFCRIGGGDSVTVHSGEVKIGTLVFDAPVPGDLRLVELVYTDGNFGASEFPVPKLLVSVEPVPPVIPEPGAATLFGVSVLLLGLARRRPKRA
jgi:hypothetical protein